MRVNIELPFFPGFYESALLYSDGEYYAMKDELEYHQNEMDEWKGLTVDDLDIDYRGYKRDCINAFIDAWRNVLPDFVEKIDNGDIWSPREYNFETDRVYVDAELADDWKDKMRIFMKENYDWLKERIKKDWSSRDGFISFIENRIEDWESPLFEDADARYISLMIGYMAYRKDEDIRDYLINYTLEGVWINSYVYVIKDEKSKN